ncbi:MAG TPA: GNAT family N-acetyltransferase [Candidatus Prevotella stercoripullorum]|nr:GNAT family N-acetyltransferase [Candidatus Prevotella stercoripullorum]
MFEIIRYSSDRKAEWDDFINRSKNGTFLFRRDYMDYHSDRFRDHSLMFYLKGRLCAVLPANVVGGTLYSHQGLTYGGLAMGDDAKAAEVCVLFGELNDCLRAQGVRKVVYKAVPWIYSRYASEEDLYAIFNVCGARLASRDISSTIFLDRRLKFGELRRRCLKKALRAGVTVRRSDDVAAFWQILDNNLESKYGVAPVHSLEELQLLMGCFPDNIRLYMSYLGDEPLGGTVVYLNGDTVHTQYISASPEGKRLGALDALFGELICNVYSSYRYFDFGRSTERGGAYLNEALIFQKEGFGGRGVCNDTYEWDI